MRRTVTHVPLLSLESIIPFSSPFVSSLWLLILWYCNRVWIVPLSHHRESSSGGLWAKSKERAKRRSMYDLSSTVVIIFFCWLQPHHVLAHFRPTSGGSTLRTTTVSLLFHFHFTKRDQSSHSQFRFKQPTCYYFRTAGVINVYIVRTYVPTTSSSRFGPRAYNTNQSTYSTTKEESRNQKTGSDQ